MSINHRLLLLASVLILLASNLQAGLKQTIIHPVKIVTLSDSTGTYIKNPQNLLGEFNDQLSVYDSVYVQMFSTDSHKASILLDFGKEIYGGIKISAPIREYTGAVKLKVCFGESVTEALSDVSIINNIQNPTNEHSMRDYIVYAPWLGSSQCGNTGFRFVRIDLLDTNVKFNLKNVSAISQMRDMKYGGSFISDNKRINDIWATGAYTVQLNMQEYLWDGIKRDRLVWVGDMHPEVMTVNSAFGANEVVYKSLDFAKKDTPLPGWMNGMCAYSLWWLIIQNDLYMYQGNLDYLKQQQDYILGLVKQIDSKVNKKGREHLDGTRFLDWPTSENPEVIASGLQSLTYMAMDAASKIGSTLGDKEMIAISEACKKRMRKISVESHNNSQAAALGILSGLSKDPKKDCAVILNNGADGFSTFYGYYMLEALAMNGKYDEALDLISKYWGAMLDLGATTFWEDLKYSDVKNAGRIDEVVPKDKYDIHADGGAYCYKGLRLSLCHGWASGPTSWLSRYVLGITPIEPGCRTIAVKPHLSTLNNVKGTFHTPYGIVKVNYSKNANGDIISDVKAPDGVKVVMDYSACK